MKKLKESCPKTIQEFIDLKLELIIPDYQRGYRWTSTQITKLLDDLYDFKGEKYSLQPITIKKVGKGRQYRVIDGQQRLTTIYLILDKYGKDKKEKYTGQIKPKNKENWEGLDKKFIDNANQIIENWRKDNEKEREKVIQTLKNAEIFIYLLETNSSDSKTSEIEEIEFFSKINSGKIALTNSEIIKGLFVKILQHDQERKRLLKQWDSIENDLQNDKFWLFISNEKNKTNTRIDFLFSLLKESDEKIKEITETKNSQYSLFLVYEDYLKQAKEPCQSVKNIWQEIRRYYSILKYLQNDINCYHLFGYLMTADPKMAKDCLIDLYKNSKTQAAQKIQCKIMEHLKKILSIKNKTEYLQIEQLNYTENKDKIRDILLLFNVITATTMQGFKFPFDTYKRTNYDVEHIHARNTKLPIENKSYMRKWLEYDGKNIKNKENPDKEALINYLTEYKNNYTKLQKAKKNLEELIKEILDAKTVYSLKQKIELFLSDFDDNDFGNLTLLDAEINRSYGNDYFHQKQNTIIQKEIEGSFILPCTKRLFLEYYTRCDKIWTQENKTEYVDKIKKCLESYLPKDMQNEN